MPQHELTRPMNTYYLQHLTLFLVTTVLYFTKKKKNLPSYMSPSLEVLDPFMTIEVSFFFKCY